MELPHTPDPESTLTDVAKQEPPAEALVEEAVARLVEYDEWFSQEVERSLAAAACGAFVGHDHVARHIESRYPR
jgi:predicted transcriptional regulator